MDAETDVHGPFFDGISPICTMPTTRNHCSSCPTWHPTAHRERTLNLLTLDDIPTRCKRSCWKGLRPSCNRCITKMA